MPPMLSIVVFSPGLQGCPPLAGAGWSHVLVLVSFIPFPIHSVQLVQSDQSPSANKDMLE
jgi:hypothetical protein